MYLRQRNEIETAIARLACASQLWIDTETADWWTKSPKLSLIQVSDDGSDRRGDSVYILDVLQQPHCIRLFSERIMANPEIEKIFHNATYDVKFLGKSTAQNITCTLKLARKLGKQRLGVSNLQLKTLAAELCQFSDIDRDSQGSNWGQRPLNQRQLHYAKLDVVYLAQVHRHLLTHLGVSHTPAESVEEQPSVSANPNFTATDVRVAKECPRLFYLGHHSNCRTVFIPQESQVSGVGHDVHRLAQEFVNLAAADSRFSQLLTPPSEQLKVEQLSQDMQQLFYDRCFYPYLIKIISTNPDSAQRLEHIWQGLKRLIDHYAELLKRNRQTFHPDQIIPKTFIDSELRLKQSYQLPNGDEQTVSGQFDNLVYDGDRQRLCVVEYKTYQPADPSAQLMQVALYADLVHRQRQQPVDAAVYCVFREFQVYFYDWDELRSMRDMALLPHLQRMRDWLTWQPDSPNPPPKTYEERLCPLCPQQNTCQTFFLAAEQSSPVKAPSIAPIPTPEPAPSLSVTPNPTPTPPPTPPPVSPPASPSPEQVQYGEQLGEELTKVLNAFGVEVTYEGAAMGPSFIRVRLKPKLGVKVSSLLRLSDDLQVQLGISVPPMISPQAGFVSVDLPRNPAQIALFEQYLTPQSLPVTAPVRVAIGVNLENKLVEADLSDPNTCHFLVGGTTGSGKSEFLRALLLSVIQRRSPEHLKLALVDPKRVTFPEFENIPWLLSPIVKDSDRAIALMEDLVLEMESRYKAFEASRCNDLPTYNQRCLERNKPTKAPIICLFDEYADFMAEKEVAKVLELSIKRLGAMARAAGIHLIIATQRPEAKVVTPLIRSNLPGRIALKTASEADSSIILGGKQGQAQNLLGKGDLLYYGGSKLQRLQSLFAPKIDLS
ncbi:MAG: PD-(D/E)XK nuclease family protein [Phormidium sp. BM_Day4_Bin.17]|nr:PD-(D/E)XK nuclease family protein [Phormidium sp. BM_Day4_Bin.17]UCJ13192.1 MAG: PD-(D/E)XK nuclease family protein [Phormidium sp. PBR-2020]